jgi:hypothetical protein
MMPEQLKLTVTLHWRDHAGVQRQDVTLPDRAPSELIPKLVPRLGLPGGDDASHTVFYRLRLDTEQGPALHSKELLSRQKVTDGSTVWLVPELLTKESQLKRCLLHLPDGTEIVVPTRGQGLTRTWLMSFLHLHNPDAYAREVERFEQYGSPYRYVSDSRPHCHLRLSDQGLWGIITDRADVVTEHAANDDYELIPPNVFVRLDNNTRIRLGGAQGLELGVVII